MPPPSTSQRYTEKSPSTESLSPSDPPKSAWEYYLDITEIEDSEREREWNGLLDVILIFAAIFASFVSTFLSQTLGLLQEDPLDAIKDILLYQTLATQNSTLGPYVTQVFSPPPYAVAVNALFFASLGVVLLAASLCMLVKGWIRELDLKLRCIPDVHKRAVVRELREQGVHRWWLPELITIIPSLIHLSLLLFVIGISVYLLQIHKLPAILSIATFGVGAVFYVLSILISTIDDFSPFRSPYSRILGALYRLLYSHLTKSFDSLSRRALPQTIGEEIREWVGTLIKKHEPLSEQAILGHSSSSSHKAVILRNSIPILNKLWTSIDKRDTSSHAKNTTTSILLQFNHPSICPPDFWTLHWLRETNRFSIEEAECLAYSVCMMSPTLVHRGFVGAMRAVIDVLPQSPDPWSHLVASLTSVWVEGAEEDLSKWPLIAYERDHVVQLQRRRPSIAGREAGILNAISNVRIFSAEQWCFVLSSVCTLFVPDDGQLGSEAIRALTKILARLLQKGLHHIQGSTICLNAHTDFWLYVTMSVLDKKTLAQHGTPMSELKSSGEVIRARDIGVYGSGMTRDPKCIRRLLRLSREHNLDQSLMRQCLVSILYILVSFGPSNQQQIKLVNQYMEIITEEMDVITWSHYLSGMLTNDDIQAFFLSQTVLCLLKGECLHSLRGCNPAEAAPIIMREYDLKLSAAGVQPTPSILKVMNEVILLPQWITGLELQNSWLSLYARNLTHSPHDSNVPVAWSSGSTSIASKRLDLYDSGKVTPEMDLVTFFLSCPSISTACRALRWYLRLEENALASGDTRPLTSILPNIFRKGLSRDEKHLSWSLFVDVLLPSLGRMSPQGRGYFVETFFGYGSCRGNNQAGADQSIMSSGVRDENVSGPDMPTPMATLQADGLGWMEDVWMTVRRRLVVRIDRVETYWPGLSGVMHATYPESARLTEPTSPPPLSPGVARDEASEGTPRENQAVLRPHTIEEHLADSARSILEVLAQLLEAEAGLIPAALLDRLGKSPLLSDERLHHDSESLRRIRGILGRNQGH